MFRSPRARLLVLIVWAGAGLSTSAASPESLSITVEWLSDPSRAGRASGGAGARATADYLLEEFRRIGLEAGFQAIGPGRQNVVGRIGDQPAHIIVGAHYDGQGRGRPSASDNAAGVAVLLELAQELAGTPLPVSVVFIAFDDEENGLNGSRYYVQNPVYPLEDLATAVILDTMGRSFMDLERWTLIVLGTEFSPELAAVVGRLDDPEIELIGTDLIGARSDFAPFAARRIPYLFFTNATHRDYHGTGDTPDRIRYDRLDRDAGTILQVILDVARLGSVPTFRTQPSYPQHEAGLLSGYIDLIEAERPDLAESYRLLFGDLRVRLEGNPSREALHLAATVLLSAATPRLSAFPLAYAIGPFYEAEGAPEIARAAYREALSIGPDPATESYLGVRLEALEVSLPD